MWFCFFVRKAIYLTSFRGDKRPKLFSFHARKIIRWLLHECNLSNLEFFFSVHIELLCSAAPLQVVISLACLLFHIIFITYFQLLILFSVFYFPILTTISPFGFRTRIYFFLLLLLLLVYSPWFLETNSKSAPIPNFLFQ